MYNLCSGLGTLLAGQNGDKTFVKNDDKCIKSLKKIRKEISYDQREEKNQTVLLLGDMGVVKNHLIPLAIAYGSSDVKILTEVTKVVVQLTMPLGVQDKGETREKRLTHLQSFKCAFIQDGALQAFIQLLEKPLQNMSSGRKDEDKLVVELVLWLVRNLLAIPDGKTSSGASSKRAHLAYLHENFLGALSKGHVTDILIHLGEYVGTEGNHEWNLVLLEIFFQIFKGTKVEDLFENNSSAPRQNDILKSRTMQNKRVSAMSSRHSKFGGLLKLSNGSLGVSKLVSNAFALSSERTKQTSSSLKQQMQSKSRGGGKRKKDELDTGWGQEHVLNSNNSVIHSSKLLQLQKKLLQVFVKRCYQPLFKALKQDFRREDIRLLPSDQVQFLFLTGLCTGFERCRVALEERDDFEWHSSPVVETMDKWTFHFVIKSCQIYLEEKKIKELEICSNALREMILLLASMPSSSNEHVITFCVVLRNSVFYDITELEVIQKMIGDWDENKSSWRHLAILTSCADAVLRIAESMVKEGAVVKSKQKKHVTKQSATKKTGKAWSSEEIAALVEASKVHGVDMKGFRKAMKDASLSPVFDTSRNADMLFHRYNQIAAHTKEQSISLEQFVEVYEEKEEEEEEEVSEDKEEVERVKAEKQLLLEPLVRPYIQGRIVKNLCSLIDPLLAPNSMFAVEIQNHVFPRFCEHILASNAGAMWHVSMLGTLGRALHAYRGDPHRAVLASTVHQIVSGFFDHARANPLAYVEILYWRTRGENEHMLAHYEDQSQRQARLRGDQMEDNESVAASDVHEERKRKYSEDSEAEANFDQVEFTGIIKRKKAKKRSKWTQEECAFLVEKYFEKSQLFPSAVCHMLSCESQLENKSADDVKHQVSKLKLFDEISKRKSSYAPDGIPLLVARILKSESSESVEWIRDCIRNGHVSIVPLTRDQFKWCDDLLVGQLLVDLGYALDGGSFWKISPCSLTSLQESIDLLLQEPSFEEIPCGNVPCQDFRDSEQEYESEFDIM